MSAIKGKAPAKIAKPAAKAKTVEASVPALGEYNGNPMLIVDSEREKFNFQFGLGKAKKLMQPAVQAALKAFVASEGKSIN